MSKDQGIPRFYANGLITYYTKSDFYVEFHQVRPGGADPIARVYLSPEVAKALAKMLNMQVDEFEKNVRKLAEPKLTTEAPTKEAREKGYISTARLLTI